MSDKKEEQEQPQWITVANDKEVRELKAKVEEHAKIIENFRISFQNLESSIINLKERNRLR